MNTENTTVKYHVVRKGQPSAVCDVFEYETEAMARRSYAFLVGDFSRGDLHRRFYTSVEIVELESGKVLESFSNKLERRHMAGR